MFAGRKVLRAVLSVLVSWPNAARAIGHAHVSRHLSAIREVCQAKEWVHKMLSLDEGVVLADEDASDLVCNNAM